MNVLKIERLSFSYPINQKALENINLEVSAGDFIGILGKNGAGKSTLINLIIGLREVQSGSLLVDGLLPKDFRKQRTGFLTYLSHDALVNFPKSIEFFFRFNDFYYPNYSLEKENQLCEVFELDKKRDFSSLSTGELRQVMIVAALAANSKLLVIDEITAVLDPGMRKKLFKILKEENQRGLTIILATNIIEDLEGVVDKILFIHNLTAEVINLDEVKKKYDE